MTASAGKCPGGLAAACSASTRPGFDIHEVFTNEVSAREELRNARALDPRPMQLPGVEPVPAETVRTAGASTAAGMSAILDRVVAAHAPAGA